MTLRDKMGGSTDANEILRVLGEKYSSRFHKQITLIGKFDKGS